MISDRRIGPDEILALTPKSVPGLWRQWYLVIVLGLVGALSNADYGALNLIINPIRADLGISDTQMSVLIGLSFTLLFSLLSLPAGYLIDLFNRRLMLASAVIFWSSMAILCGLATSYWQLFAARMGIGLGEAMLVPAAYSLIRDGVAIRSWGRAYALFHLISGAGTNLGNVAGGTIYGLATAGALAAVPLLGPLKPWQAVLVVPGLFGVVVVGLLLTLREPARVASTQRHVSSFGEVFAHIARHRRVYLPIFGSYVMIGVAYTGWITWLPAAMGRRWDISPADIGKTAGSIGFVMSPLPSFLYGYAMDRLTTKGNLGGPFTLAAAGLALNGAMAVATLLAPSIRAMWIFYGLTIFCSISCVGTATSIMLTEVTPDHLMGKMTSLYNMGVYLLGNATGPTIFALVAEYGFSGPRAITNSMLICYPTVLAIIIVILLAGQRQIRRRQAL